MTELSEGLILPFCGGPLVSVFAHIVARGCVPMAPDCARLYLTSLLPLVGFENLSLFSKNVKHLLLAVLPVNPHLVLPTLRAFERYWAHTSSQKQIVLLDLIICVCKCLPQDVIEHFVRGIFRFFASCLNSPNSRIVDAILDIWLKATNGDWMWNNAKCAIGELIESTTTVSEKHWRKETCEKASNALTEMARIDKATFHKLRQQQKQMKAQRFQRKYVSNDCQRHWYQVAEAAVANFADFNLNSKKHEMYDLFHNEKPATLAPTRFISLVEKKEKREKS
jgi:hypothetical protein